MHDERYIAAVDLGSTKLALSVAKVEGNNIQIIYYKERPSDGIRYSLVFNPGKASGPLKAAISDAEADLGIKILQVVLGLPRYNVRQVTGTANTERPNPSSCITHEEISTLKAMAIDDFDEYDADNEEIYGAVAQSFSADNDMICANEDDVIGATANNISGNYKIFIGTQKPVKNIDNMLNAVGVAPACKLFLPSAVARAVLSEQEKENGVALIDFGGGVASITIYRGGILRHYSSIPFGGDNITKDIQYECGFSKSLAENIKLAYGSCQPEKLQTMSEKIIQINDDETGAYEQLHVKYLSEIIHSRTREIIEALLFQIQESGYADRLRSGVVLTGGCADLVNLSGMLRDMSGYSVRIGYPRHRLFSSQGCAGVGEAGAAATIGLILEAQRDCHLNCIEAAPVFVPKKGDEEAEDAALFSTQEVQPEIIKPGKTNKDKSARKTIWSTLRKNASETFDGTIGSLFDSMEQ